MTHELMQAYADVERAMESYTKALEQHVSFLKSSERADLEQIERMTYGARAMRDSAMIYLSYAKFIAQGMPKSEELAPEDIQG